MFSMHSTKLQQAKGLTQRLPWKTLLTIAAAVMVAQFPGWSTWLVYDRSAILAGQVWRMFTGHWVHFSSSHLCYDSVALGIAGWIIETQKLPKFGWLCLLAPWFISAALLFLAPQMEIYGGLSALATAALVYLGLCGLLENSSWRWVCLVVLAGVAIKIGAEMLAGHMLFATTANSQITVSTASHCFGVAVALMLFCQGISSSKNRVIFRRATWLESPQKAPAGLTMPPSRTAHLARS